MILFQTNLERLRISNTLNRWRAWDSDGLFSLRIWHSTLVVPRHGYVYPQIGPSAIKLDIRWFYGTRRGRESFHIYHTPYKFVQNFQSSRPNLTAWTNEVEQSKTKEPPPHQRIDDFRKLVSTRRIPPQRDGLGDSKSSSAKQKPI